MFSSLIVWMDFVGTVAFAISGAMVAARKNMDIFGVNMLAVLTATGGGMIRDIIIGRTPPVIFLNPSYVLIAVLTANILFLVLYSRKSLPLSQRVGEQLLFWFDTLGLAAFTVDGVFAGVQAQHGDKLFLIAFLGVMTGVGGGALRDIFADEMPQIFVKHVYAVASVAGAVVTGLFWRITAEENIAVAAGALTVIALRYEAVRHHWNLPRLR